MVTKCWWSRKDRFFLAVSGWIKLETIQSTWKKCPADATRPSRWWRRLPEHQLRAGISRRQINERTSTFRRGSGSHTQRCPPPLGRAPIARIGLRLLDGAWHDFYRAGSVAGHP